MEYIDTIMKKKVLSRLEELRALKKTCGCKGDFAKKLLEMKVVVYFADGLIIYDKI